jgi:predicted 3-demethylubiquinone-9 3-methyltransferase (glyoxalase superfamily)
VQKIVTNLWFATEAEEAAYFYTSIFKNSKINKVSRHPEGSTRPAGEVVTVDFELDGVPFTAINGNPAFRFTEATSLMISCEDQAEVDEMWEKLTADGGE